MTTVVHVVLPVRTKLQPSSILVLSHAGIGDTVMLLPLLVALKEAYPNARLSCTVDEPEREVIELAGLDVVFVPWPSNWRRDIRGLLRGAANVRSLEPETLIVPCGMNLRLAAWLARLSRARIRIAALPAFEDQSQVLSLWHRSAFSEILPRNWDAHKVETLKKILDVLGVKAELRAPSISLSPELVAGVRRRLIDTTGLDSEGPGFICIHATGEPKSNAKAWPAERMLRSAAEVCRRRGLRALLLWGPAEEDDLRKSAGPDSNGLIVRVPWQTSIAETSALLELGQGLLTNDSGLMHLGAALGKRVLAVFGPTNPGYCGPFSSRSSVIYHEVECGPCYPGPHFLNCPNQHKCLMNISSEVVEAALDRVLADDAPTSCERRRGDILFLQSPFLACSKLRDDYVLAPPQAFPVP